MSYLGYADEIAHLLKALSHNTLNYYIKHSPSLRGFLVEWGPRTANEVLDFGNDMADWNRAFPSEETLELHPRLTEMTRFKLHRIHVSLFQNDGVLAGIQLELSDKEGWILHEMFKTEDCGRKTTAHAVDMDRPIRSISMKIDADMLYGLRLTDERGEHIVDATWCNSDFQQEWITKQIPEGRQIMGLLCNTENAFIQRIGFVLSRSQ